MLTITPTPTESHDIMVCIDCAMLTATGDTSDRGTLPGFVDATDDGAHLYNLPDDDASENPNTRHAAIMDAQWPFSDGWHVTTASGEEDPFSSATCEGCGSRLGGVRIPAVAMRQAGLGGR